MDTPDELDEIDLKKRDSRLKAIKQLSKMTGYEDNPKITIVQNPFPKFDKSQILQN